MSFIKDIHEQVLITAKPKHEKNQELHGAAYVFSYHIFIQNLSNYTIQLKRRQWYIADGLFEEREVEGIGVIGQVPVLKPGEKFEYESWCPLASEYGSMGGFFTFTELESEQIFEVEIPTMVLLPEFVLN